MFPTGRQLRGGSCGSVPRRTSTARVPWQCSRRASTARELRLAVPPAGPQPRASRTSTASQKICQIESQKICQEYCRNSTRKNVRRYARKNCRRYARNNVRKTQNTYQNRCRNMLVHFSDECQNRCQYICPTHARTHIMTFGTLVKRNAEQIGQ